MNGFVIGLAVLGVGALLFFLVGRFRAFSNLIKPAGELQAELNRKIANASRKWETAATLDLPDGKLLVCDPRYCNPLEAIQSEGPSSAVLTGRPGPAKIQLELVYEGKKVLTVSSARVLFMEKLGTRTREVCSVAVDAAQFAIASVSGVRNSWRVGGAKSESSLYISNTGDERQRAERTRAAVRALEGQGFAMKPNEIGVYDFRRALNDQEIKAANQMIRSVAGDGFVNVILHESAARLSKQLERNWLALLDDRTRPYLVSFVPGWGDGLYRWFALEHEEVLVGYFCSFAGDDTQVPS